MKKIFLSGVMALSLLTSCAGSSNEEPKGNVTADTTAAAVTEETTEPAEVTTSAESLIENYQASPGKPYIPFPDFTGYDITDPFSYEAGKPEVSGNSETYKTIAFHRDGLKICGELYLPEGDGPFPTVVISSGQSASYARYKDEAQAFAADGIACIISDYTGTVGNSSSDGELTDSSVFTEAQDLNVILDSLPDIPKVDTENVFLWGHSLGGLVSTVVGGGRPDDIRGMILLEPSFEYPEVTRYLNPDLSQVNDIVNEPEKYNTLVGKQFIIDMCSLDSLKYAEKYGKDVLMIFGNAGPDRSARPSLMTYYPKIYSTAENTFPSCEMVTVDGADHLFEGNYGKTAVERSIDFVKEHIL